MKSPLGLIAGSGRFDKSDAELSACISEIDPAVRNLMEQGLSASSIVGALALAQLTVLVSEHEADGG